MHKVVIDITFQTGYRYYFSNSDTLIRTASGGAAIDNEKDTLFYELLGRYSNVLINLYNTTATTDSIFVDVLDPVTNKYYQRGVRDLFANSFNVWAIVNTQGSRTFRVESEGIWALRIRWVATNGVAKKTALTINAFSY